ncbi:MAG: YlmH/Sll1252 family protein [Christensenellales bacterium]
MNRRNVKFAGCFSSMGEEASSSDFPLVTLHSALSLPSSVRFHRDLLGAFMALGLTRDAIGDIIIVDSDIYLFVVAQTADFIVQGMHSAGKAYASLRTQSTVEIRIPEPRGSLFSRYAQLYAGLTPLLRSALSAVKKRVRRADPCGAGQAQPSFLRIGWMRPLRKARCSLSRQGQNTASENRGI